MRNLTLIFFLFTTISSQAQNLPGKQENSVWAPGNIKIDGKTTEWGNTFKAYNHATNLYYTIANDDKNVYFVFHTDDPDALTKLTTVGMKLTVNSGANNNTGTLASIWYPFYDGVSRPYMSFKSIPKTPAEGDSVMRSRNKKLDFNSKYLKISGMPGVDSLISVYNENGISTRQAFDNVGFYTCEMAIPLKYINIAKNNPKFTYSVALPGIDIRKDFGYTRTKNAGGMTVVTVAGGDGVPSKEHLAAVTSTTDFTGEYTLAKAP